MKNLTLLNDNTNIKLNDTGTVIQFKASNEGQPVGLSNGQSAVFRIKNELGFLKSVQATTSYGGYVFELDTSNLSDLVPDTYQVELLIQVDSDNALIFPDKGFVQFSINANALNITGEQLPVMSLEDFKDELKTYVTNQTTQATTNIKNDFDTYVDNLTDSTVATATKASQDAQTATTKANNAQSTADTANNKATANASLITSLNTLFSKYVGTYGLPGGTDFNNLPLGIYSLNGWGGLAPYNNVPSFVNNKAWYIVACFYNNYAQYQFILPDWGDIYYRIIKPDGTIKSDWKKFAFNTI